MKKIKLLRRTHVSRIGTCEAGSETTCHDETAAYLVKTKLAEYASKEDAESAAKEAASAKKDTK